MAMVESVASWRTGTFGLAAEVAEALVRTGGGAQGVGDGDGRAGAAWLRFGIVVPSRARACCSWALVRVPAATAWSSWLLSAGWSWVRNWSWERPLAAASCSTVLPD